MHDVSLVITSCGRLDLLDRTVRSFNQHNTYPIARAVVIDDSADASVHQQLREDFAGSFDDILCNDPKLGQIASIDRAYAVVDTPFIFHCEDDWLFYRGGFIEDSMAVLAEDERIVTVWLRELAQFSKDRIGAVVRSTDTSVTYRDILSSANSNWHGFTFNPGLRRRADYERIQPFTAVGHEYEINLRYRELGFHAAILEHGATEHIGFNRSERKKEIGSHGKKRTWLQKRLGLNKKS